MKIEDIPKADRLKPLAIAINLEIETLLEELNFRINRIKKLTDELLK